MRPPGALHACAQGTVTARVDDARTPSRSHRRLRARRLSRAAPRRQSGRKPLARRQPLGELSPLARRARAALRLRRLPSRRRGRPCGRKPVRRSGRGHRGESRAVRLPAAARDRARPGDRSAGRARRFVARRGTRLAPGDRVHRGGARGTRRARLALLSGRASLSACARERRVRRPRPRARASRCARLALPRAARRRVVRGRCRRRPEGLPLASSRLAGGDAAVERGTRLGRGRGRACTRVVGRDRVSRTRGLPGAPAPLVRHRGGELVLGVRDPRVGRGPRRALAGPRGHPGGGAARARMARRPDRSCGG